MAPDACGLTVEASDGHAAFGRCFDGQLNRDRLLRLGDDARDAQLMARCYGDAELRDTAGYSSALQLVCDHLVNLAVLVATVGDALAAGA